MAEYQNLILGDSGPTSFEQVNKDVTQLCEKIMMMVPEELQQANWVRQLLETGFN